MGNIKKAVEKIVKKVTKKPVKKTKKITTLNVENGLKVTRKTLIGEAVQIHPLVAGVMFEYGLHCIGCAVSTMETIEQGCEAHGLSDKQIDEMVAKINKNIEKENKNK